MTTKVVKGSAWTLAGSVLPLAVSFITTPFIIRFLGSEAYGVLLLVGLIPTYFSFADFGMGVASTKFASEAYGEGDEKKEAEIVWTATAIAAVSSLIVAIPILLFSYPIVQAMNVPEHLLSQASLALKITSASFVVGILASVLNSPMLARLRMELNTATSAAPKIVMAVVTPLILYAGGGIVEAVAWALFIGIATALIVLFSSYSTQPQLMPPAFNKELVRPLYRFGGGWVLAAMAGALLANVEKLFVARLVSVEHVAFYSVAFTLAYMTTIGANAMLQSLIPAFSRLSGARDKEAFDRLFSRGMRITIIWLMPLLTILFVIAEPFFTIWAGPEFGKESTIPFYILLAGLFFGMWTFVPNATLLARGRTDILAKVFWIELPLYLVLIVVFVSWYGVVGAALAWSVRSILEAIVIVLIARKVSDLSFPLLKILTVVLIALVVLAPPILITVFFANFKLLAYCLLPITLVVYAALAWSRLLSESERSLVLFTARRFI
jgi:O-antigen/teichoic acid export membrane protein